MIRTLEAVIDEQGKVRLLQPIRIPAARRALVTILEECPAVDPMERGSAEAWRVPSDGQESLLGEAAAWDAASDEDALKIEKMLSETK